MNKEILRALTYSTFQQSNTINLFDVNGHLYYGVELYIDQNSYHQSRAMEKENNGIQQSLMSSSNELLENEIPEQLPEAQVEKTGTPGKTIFTLMAAAMGTGMFNLPLRNEEIGIIPFALFLIVNAFVCYKGSCMIYFAYEKLKAESYTEMVVKLFGKGLSRLGQAALILFPLGNSISYIVIIPKFINQLLYDVFDLPMYSDREDEVYSDEGNTVRIFASLGVVLLNIFFILKRDIAILQKLAMFGVCSIFLNVAIIIHTAMTGFTKTVDGNEVVYHGIFHLDWQKADPNWISISSLEDVSLLFQGCASIMFVYINHQLVVPSIKNLPSPSNRLCSNIFLKTAVFEFVPYIVMGFTAYILLSEHTDLYPIEAMAVASIETGAISFGKVFLICALFIALPLNLFPARTIFFETFAINYNSQRNFYIVSLGLAGFCLLVGITFQSVNSYFGLLGGIMGSIMALIIPALCYVKLNRKLAVWDYLSIFVMELIALISIVGGVLSVADSS